MIELLTEKSAPEIVLTPSAVKQVQRQIEKKGGEMNYLRLGVKGGGCSGLSYVMHLEGAPNEGDHLLTFDSVQVLVDPRSARFLSGMTLDYSTANLLDGGWKFVNPNAAKSCGCGTSFTPR